MKRLVFALVACLLLVFTATGSAVGDRTKVGLIKSGFYDYFDV